MDQYEAILDSKAPDTVHKWSNSGRW